MSVILGRIFIRAGTLLTHQSVRNRSLVSKFNENFKAYSTLVHTNSNDHENNDLSDGNVLQSHQNSVPSVLEELQTEQLPDVSHMTPELRPSFNFAYYANKSEVIKQLIDLGVDFHKIESKKKLPSFLIQLDFEKDVKPYISFLFDNGVPADQLGRFFTKNPFLLQESLDDLEVRINYLKSKRFTPDMISRIITINPYWLSYTTQKIDEILGDFQKQIGLKAFEIRQVVCQRPSIIEVRGFKLRDNLFLFKDIVEFDREQTKQLFLKVPYVWSLARSVIHERIDVMLVDMEVSLSTIVAQPSGLLCRAHKLKERHLFLKELGKAQYDPTKPGYVSIDDISIGSDATFCDKVAKTSINTYNLFLKTL